MRVLLTGASGFIGQALAGRLQARGDTVVPVRRGRGGPGEVGIDLAADRLDLSALPEQSLEGIDASVHLAGAPIFTRWSAGHKEAIRASRIAVGHLVARSLAALSEPPSVHITGSAVGYYGERGDEVLEESSPPGNGFLPDVCRAWEEAAAPASKAGIRTVAVRTGIVLGAGGILRAQLPIFRAGLGGKLGNGRQWMSWISLEDEVSCLLRAIDDPGLSGPINATAPNPVRNADFTATLARLLKRPAVLFVPAPALRLALGTGPTEEMLLVSQRAHPGVLEGAGFSFAHPGLEEALAASVA